MRYRVKQTDLSLSLETQSWLAPNVDTADVEAPDAMAAVSDFIRSKGLRRIGAIDEGTGGTANAMCKYADGRYTIIRAFPHSDPDP